MCRHFCLGRYFLGLFRSWGLPIDYLRFILEEPWWSFPRAITKAFTCLDLDRTLVGPPDFGNARVVG